MECLYRTTNCAAKAEGKKTPAAAAGGPGDRAVDAGEGVLVKQEKGGTVTKKMRVEIWQQRGNWGTLQNQNQGLARGRNKTMSSKSRSLICWTKKMMTLICISNLCPKN